MRFVFLSFVAVSALAMASSSTLANLVVNGSFESPVVTEADGVHATYWYDPQYLPGWGVGQVGPDGDGSSVDVNNSTGYSGWQAADGDQSIDLSGNYAGSIGQTLSTVAGDQYILSFALAGNPNTPDDPIKTVQVNWGDDAPFDISFDTTGKTLSNMGWVTETYVLTADSDSTLLNFTSLNDSDAGPAIDNVSVNLLPEPSLAWVAFWGAGLFGFCRRSKG